MSKLSFLWDQSTPLAVRLSQPVVRISIKTAQHGRPIAVTLWHPNGTGLRIESSMHDIADREELGVLGFKDVAALDTDDVPIIIPASFGLGATVEKLTIHESGTTADSGVVLKAGDGKEIVVVAGAYPYSLAVQGVSPIPHIFEPEYPLTAYTRASIS